MRNTEINPGIAIGVGVAVLAGALYLFIVRPNMALDKLKRDWNTPEAAAARSPEGRTANPAYENAVRAALEKEGRTRGGTRRRD